MSDAALGGDPPCWAHVLDDADATAPTDDRTPLAVDLGTVPVRSGGAIWSLPHGGDLDANLIRLDPGARIDAHVNDELDVLVFVHSGTGELTVDNQEQQLSVDHLALIPKGSTRTIAAGDSGITYLSVHRQRGPLGITRREDRSP